MHRTKAPANQLVAIARSSALHHSEFFKINLVVLNLYFRKKINEVILKDYIHRLFIPTEILESSRWFSPPAVKQSWMSVLSNWSFHFTQHYGSLTYKTFMQWLQNRQKQWSQKTRLYPPGVWILSLNYFSSNSPAAGITGGIRMFLLW